MTLLTRLVRRIFPDAVPTVHRPPPAGTASDKNIIVILGWGGAKQRNLRRLIGHYNGKGMTVIAQVMPMYVTAFARNYFLSEMLSRMKEESESSPAAGNLVAHVYSNNGTWTLSDICHKQEIDSSLKKFTHVIMDSCPYLYYDNVSLWTGAYALSRVYTSIVLQRPQYEHPIVTPLIRLFLYPYLAVYRSLVKVHLVPNLVHKNIYIRDHFPKIPSLFVYSDGDKLIPTAKVEEFMEIQRQRKVPIETELFGESVAHTAAFYKEPERYARVVDKFLGLKKDL